MVPFGSPEVTTRRDLRVGIRSVQRRGRPGYEAVPGLWGLKGPASLPLLSDALFAVLEAELDKAPAAHGWPDQAWTLARIKPSNDNEPWQTEPMGLRTGFGVDDDLSSWNETAAASKAEIVTGSTAPR
jgi:hypothetical protein